MRLTSIVRLVIWIYAHDAIGLVVGATIGLGSAMQPWSDSTPRTLEGQSKLSSCHTISLGGSIYGLPKRQYSSLRQPLSSRALIHHLDSRKATFAIAVAPLLMHAFGLATIATMEIGDSATSA